MRRHLTEIQQILRQQKPLLADRYGVREIGVFGSHVRGQEHPDSDLDILVELEKPVRTDLIGFVEMQDYLTDRLGMQVDLVLREELKPGIGERILAELVPV